VLGRLGSGWVLWHAVISCVDGGLVGGGDWSLEVNVNGSRDGARAVDMVRPFCWLVDCSFTGDMSFRLR
jgi:hypothetical protein